MMNINLPSLKKIHGDNAEKIFREVAQIGGFGDVEPNNPGGLDISGLSESTQAHIRKLVEKEPEQDKEPVTPTQPTNAPKDADKKEGKK